MHSWGELGPWKDRHEELLREAERERLARQVREGRVRVSREEGRREVPEGIEVRWGLLEDEAKIADLLQLNGMPRWAAFEERYVVAERDGEILAAARYRTEKGRLVLGLLIVDPWVEERQLAVALYAGARELAREMCAGEVVARPFPRTNYPGEAGYLRRGRHEWRLDTEGRKEFVGARLRRLFGLFGSPAVPFFGHSSARR